MDHNKIYHYEYEYNNVKHSYSIEIKDFIAGRDALAYMDKKDSIIATIEIWDYRIDLLVDGFSTLENLITSEEYIDYIPDFLHEFLDINCEYNLEKQNIVIKERNYFEFFAYRLVSNTLSDVRVEFTKRITCLPNSLESFLEDLKTFVIYLIQSDCEYEFECNSLDEEEIWEIQQIIASNSIDEEEFMGEFMEALVDNTLDLFLD